VKAENSPCKKGHILPQKYNRICKSDGVGLLAATAATEAGGACMAALLPTIV